jgi:putative salt-induced outer membrane protein YdiY
MSIRDCFTLLSLCLTTLASTPLFAEGEGWLHEVDLGLNGVTGNSESTTIHTGYSGKYKDEDHGWKLITAYDKTKSDGEISRNQFFTDMLKDWFWNGSPWFAFFQGRYDWDEFKDWDYRLSGSTGIGYEFIHNDSAYVVGRLGVGGNKIYGDIEEELLTKEASIGLDASWSISDRQSVDFKTTFYPSLEEGGEYRSLTAFNWKMVVSEQNRLSMKIGLINEYDSLAAPGTERSDSKYNLSLVWGL